MLKVARKLQLVGLLGLRSNQHFDALAEVSGGCGAAIGTASYTRGSVDPGRKPCKTFTSLNSALPVYNPPTPHHHFNEMRMDALPSPSDSLPHPGGRSPPGLPTGPQDPLAAFEMTRLALLKMYNQREGMGAEGIRPPMPLPNMPLPPDMASLHQDKVSRECLSESRSTFALAGVEPSRGDEAARGGDAEEGRGALAQDGGAGEEGGGGAGAGAREEHSSRDGAEARAPCGRRWR